MAVEPIVLDDGPIPENCATCGIELGQPRVGQFGKLGAYCSAACCDAAPFVPAKPLHLCRHGDVCEG